MASGQVIVCQSCLEIVKEKYLKCDNCCGKGVHHACSPFKASELKFIENNLSLTWKCDTCIKHNLNLEPMNLKKLTVPLTQLLNCSRRWETASSTSRNWRISSENRT